jgi:hypothetical protein
METLKRTTIQVSRMKESGVCVCVRMCIQPFCSNSPEYNAVCVTLFCLHENCASRAIDFLQPVFEMFPDKDYLLLTLPHNSFQNNLIQYFVYIPPKSLATFPFVIFLLLLNFLRA